MEAGRHAGAGLVLGLAVLTRGCGDATKQSPPATLHVNRIYSIGNVKMVDNLYCILRKLFIFGSKRERMKCAR